VRGNENGSVNDEDMFGCASQQVHFRDITKDAITGETGSRNYITDSTGWALGEHPENLIARISFRFIYM